MSNVSLLDSLNKRLVVFAENEQDWINNDSIVPNIIAILNLKVIGAILYSEY